MTEHRQSRDPQATPRETWVDRHGLFAFLGLLCLLLLVAAYSNHFENGFHFDDSHVILDNIAIRSLHDVGSFFVDARTFSAYPKNASYRPLLTLSHAFDYWRAGGLRPGPFHRTQFALLILLGAGLVWLFKTLLDLTEPSAWNRYVALFGATLFCVHTANTETVNYICARSSLVATLGVVAAMLIYVAWPGGRRTYLYLLPVVIGGLAKPLTVMFAPILFVFILLFEEETGADAPFSAAGRRRIVAALKRAFPAFAVSAFLFLFLSRMDAETAEYANLSRWDYLLTQPFVWLHYVRLFFLPLGLTADSDWKIVTDWYDTRVIAGVLFIGTLLAGAVWFSLRRQFRLAAFGLAWFCLALIPTSSVMPLSEVYNEHRIFFPYIGLTLAVSWLAFRALRHLFETRLADKRWAAPTVTVLILAALLAHAVGTHARNRVWKDDESLWGDVVLKSPANGRGLMNYGLTLMGQGRLEEALGYFNRASLFTPDYPHLVVNLGVVNGAMGRYERAETHFRRAIELAPDYAGSHDFYGRWLADNGRAYEAIRNLEIAVAISPTDADPRALLLRLYVAAGFEDKLRALARDTLAMAPDDETARAFIEDRLPLAINGEMAEDFRLAGRRMLDEAAWLDAAATLRHALRLEEDSAVAWNNLGWARLKLGLPDLAAPCFSRAFELDPTMEVAGNNLREARRQILSLRR